MRVLGHLELDQALEGEPGDDRRLRRQVGEPLHVEVELLLPELERVPLDAGEQHLFVRLQHSATASTTASALVYHSEGCAQRSCRVRAPSG